MYHLGQILIRALTRLNSRPTPGITRRPVRLQEFDKQRVGGRVQAVIGGRGSFLRFDSVESGAREGRAGRA
jgi:hypothetical protein